MIRNIVFDMGGVLIDYDPEKTLYGLFDAPTAQLLLREIFRNPLWGEKDRGTVSPADILAQKRAVIPPEHYARVAAMVENYYPYMPPFPEPEGLVRALKANGYGVYLLSNASMDFHEHRTGIPALQWFDGCLISAEVLHIKPEPEIYQAFFERFSLRPETCFFIDDVQANIDGAARCGMAGYRHDHTRFDALLQALQCAGVTL